MSKKPITKKTSGKKVGTVLKTSAPKPKQISQPKPYWNARLTGWVGGAPLVECTATPADMTFHQVTQYSVKIDYVRVVNEFSSASAADLRELAAKIQQAADWFETKQNKKRG